MRESLTPKQVARAIGVSESSVKRWCDGGLLQTERTAGGHRRIPFAEVVRFVRTHQRRLARPEVLGLPATTGHSPRVLDRAREQFREALVDGDSERCVRIAFDLYLAKHALSVILDHVVAQAFHDIGDLWACGEVKVYQERRGCEISLRALHELRKAIPEPNSDAPLAIGGTPEGDPYWLPTTMVELVFQDVGWRARSLGSCLPLETLKAAIHDQVPSLFWLSVSHLEDTEQFLSEYAELYEQIGANIPMAVGGCALTEAVRCRMKYTAHCDNLQQLDSFAMTMLSMSRRRDG